MKTIKIFWITLISIQAFAVLFWSIITVWAYIMFGTEEIESIKTPYPYFIISLTIFTLTASIYGCVRHLKNLGKPTVPETYGDTGKSIAPLSSRLFATVIDALVLFPIWGLPYFIEYWQVSYYFVFFSCSYLYFIYDLIFDWRTGQTIGKKIMNIQVYQLDGKKLTFKHAFLRSTPYNFIAVYMIIAAAIDYSRFSDSVTLQLTYLDLTKKLEQKFQMRQLGDYLYSIVFTIDFMSMCLRSDNRAIHDLIGKVIVLQNKKTNSLEDV